MGTGLKFLFVEEVTMKQGTILGSQIGRWMILAALVVVLGALLLTIRPLGAQEAPPVPDPIASQTISVPENTVAVERFSATDRDENDSVIYWTLGGTNAATFKIDGGVLEFKAAPDYEKLALGSYSYEVTVRMSSGGEDGAPGQDDHRGDDVEEIDITVNVTNVNEDGSVVFYPLQPQETKQLRAYLADPDGGVRGETWQWASHAAPANGSVPDAKSSGWTDIAALATDSVYRPTADDLGKYLRVTVKYVDAAGGTADKPNEATLVSALAVRKDTVTSNAAPKFPDQSGLGITVNGETAPFRSTTERFVLRERGCRNRSRRASDRLRRRYQN